MASSPVLEALAREGRLYPSVILHGLGREERFAQAMRLARILLCERQTGDQDCECRHCCRLQWPPPSTGDGAAFHPDLLVLRRDLRTATSADSTRELLRCARLSPFEARGQVFIIREADTLTDEAASALLKILEEPPRSAPRNFLLSSPNPDVLLPTLRSRSMSFYLGPPSEPDPDSIRDLGDRFSAHLAALAESGSNAYLLAAAQVLLESANWDDPRSGEPWMFAAAALLQAYRSGRLPAGTARGVLDLASELIDGAPQMRVRSIPAQRILEGLVSKHLGPIWSATSPSASAGGRRSRSA